MPKVVDPEARRAAIAEAAVAVIARDGIDHASLRTIAAEAGLVVGSVRHYFPAQADVISFAMRRLADDVGVRVLRAAQPVLEGGGELDGSRRRAVSEEVLSELLPLDEERRRESAAWLAFATASASRPELQPISRDFRDGVRMIVRRILVHAQRHGGLPPGATALDVETERLAALLDGLAADAVLHAEVLPVTTMRAVLRRHLDGLLGTPD